MLLATSLALVTHGWFYDVVLAAQVALLARGGGRRRDRALLRARDLGDRGRALELPPARRSRDVAAGRGHALNRALDVLIAGTGLAVTSPLLAVGGAAVKLEDGGPVLYRQTRVGQDGATSSC